MNINWKVRLKSGSWWLGIISAVVTAVFAILQLCDVALPVTAEQVLQAATLVLMIPAAIGITTDPTTKGVGDSAQAMAYDAPKQDIATDEQAGE